MNASHVEERTHFVIVKLTAEEAKQLGEDLPRAISAALVLHHETQAASLLDLTKRLELFTSALGVALAQLPKEGE